MRWYHKVLILLTLVVLLVLFVFFGMKITTVHVEGTRMYSADEIKQSVFSRKYADNEFFFLDLSEDVWNQYASFC